MHILKKNKKNKTLSKRIYFSGKKNVIKLFQALYLHMTYRQGLKFQIILEMKIAKFFFLLMDVTNFLVDNRSIIQSLKEIMIIKLINLLILQLLPRKISKTNIKIT